ncbi:MAG: hypothetical protein COT14_02645 [Candidatus Diapherotrites archaeon CG08_land_8_20_14_0_20_30_16]|nr:MAG: hypothetical protein COT14_02645 [Candidatus Diapherotrites archaeon CG08_land_8_20_14_0_20_30_16]
MLENELPEARTVTTKLLTVNSSLEALEKELLSLFAAIEKAETKKVKKELNDRLLDVQKRRNKLLKERGRLKEQLSRILIRNVPKKKKTRI